MIVQINLSKDENELFTNYKKRHYLPEEILSDLIKSCFVQYLKKNINPKLQKSHYWKDIDVDYCAKHYPDFTNEHFDVLCYMAGWIGSDRTPDKKIIDGKNYYWISIRKIVNDLFLDKTQLKIILDDLKNKNLIYSETDCFEYYFRVNTDKLIRILDFTIKNSDILQWLYFNQDCLEKQNDFDEIFRSMKFSDDYEVENKH